MALVVVDSLTVQAGEGRAAAVREVSFALEAGERMAIVGRSGAGKTVVAMAVAGLLRPPLGVTGGRIIWNGRDPGGSTPATRREVFYLFQNPGTALSPCVAVQAQVERAVGTRDRGERKRRAREALATVGLEGVASQYPFQLSGGMRQRVLMAMALAMRPLLVIADEPTTGQDPVTQSEILECLDGSLQATGAALLFITHDVRAAARTCPRALVLDGGKVVACSTWEGLGAGSAAGAELVQAVRRLGQ